jgi:hypothetical protein
LKGFSQVSRELAVFVEHQQLIQQTVALAHDLNAIQMVRDSNLKQRPRPNEKAERYLQ